MKKVLVFSDTHWSLGRIHRGIAKQLKAEYEFRFIDWADWDFNYFLESYNWCDKCISNLVAYKVLKPTFGHNIDFNKFIFVSHGYPEHDDIQYEPNIVYGVTSDSLISFFPEFITPLLMPNGVDPDDFNYLPKDGTITNLGWCGAPHVLSKQINWAMEISNKSGLPLRIANDLSYDQLKTWYNTIDLLLVTSIPQANQESGPLPPFEAIVSGVPVIGTPVGNFRNVPGPKFTTIKEAIVILNRLRNNPDEVKQIQKLQYDYVMNNYTFEKVAPYWKIALQFS